MGFLTAHLVKTPVYHFFQHMFPFSRLWHHYSPNNSAKISYELFLDKLGFGDGHNFKIVPVCTKLGMETVYNTVDIRNFIWGQDTQINVIKTRLSTVYSHASSSERQYTVSTDIV